MKKKWKDISHQTSENSRLQYQIISVKAEKNTLQNQLIDLKRRISDLEMQVGTDDVKFKIILYLFIIP